MKRNQKSSRDDRLTEYDELVISQLKPSIGGASVCCILALFCLAVIGFDYRLVSFWLCIATVLIDIILVVCSIHKATHRK